MSTPRKPLLFVVHMQPFDEELAAHYFACARTPRELAAVAARIADAVPSLDLLRAALWRLSEVMETPKDAAALREVLVRLDIHNS